PTAVGRVHDEGGIKVGALRAIEPGGLAGPGKAAVVGSAEEGGRSEAGDGGDVIDDVGVGLADGDVAAVAAVAQGPGVAPLVMQSSVVLRSAQGDAGVGGVDGNALELERAEVAVEVLPGDGADVGVVQSPDAAVVAVEQLPAG